MYVTHIDKEINDKRAQPILSSYGCQAAIIKRLNDNRYDWIGSIFCEFTHPIDVQKKRHER